MNARTSFWDRRRAAVREEAEAEAREVEAAQIAALPPEPEQTDAEILETLGLPDPDTLEAGDDFTAFMIKAVPHHLRNRALRKLWRSNPVLACLDGLNDYDDDYLTGSTGNGPIKTAYQVGKGMTFHVEKMAKLKAMAEEALAGTPCEEPVEAAPEETPAQDEPLFAATPAAAPEIDAPVQIAEAAPEDAPAMPAPRRMVFTYQEGTA
ncbi:Protein of unknown function [Sulfitobacter brevis]|uniref:DUF3306 domain-containing protein n=1 Tax=Sulfitobacter brevis TaxID=74348 RepID=A0A1I2DVS5_9RHOB|nr:Protein of unknown function [Sulfitobacter brevis]